MLTNCKDEGRPPKKSCLREILDTLLIYHNDYNRMTVEMKNLQTEFKIETKRLQFPCEELKRVMCCKNYDKTEGESFMKRMGQMNEVYNCFTRRIEELDGHLKVVLDNARNCLVALNTSKDHLRKSHERNVEDLKRRAIKSRNPIKTEKYEKEIAELQKLFVRDVTYIKQIESQLQPFLELLGQGLTQAYVQPDGLKNYEWHPAVKRFDAVDSIGDSIKTTMGSSLVQAFAQMHIYQPTDVRGYLAAFLLNLERNQKILEEKMELLKAQPAKTVVCEQTL